MAIVQNIILIWTGTTASIPSGWERATALDELFPKGTADGVDPGISGGADTHSHTAPSHSHTMVDHSHSVTTNASPTSVGNEEGGSATDTSHTHTGTIGGTTGGTLNAETSYQSTSSLPGYYGVIYIKPSGGSASITDGIAAFFGGSSVPSGWTFCNGDGGTPDLRNKFLRGAMSAGDSGDTGGGATHSHTVDHTHLAVNHSHSGDSDWSTWVNRSSASGSPTTGNHNHTITLSNSSTSSGAYVGTAGSADTVEPPYKKVLAIKNTSGGISEPDGIIGLWIGSLKSLPVDWTLCDGSGGSPDLRDKFVKIANISSEIGDTGGSASHTHTASNSHTHTATGTHTHTGSVSTFNANAGVNGDTGVHSSQTHNHTINTVSSETATWSNSTIISDGSSSEPAYLTVAYLMYAPAAAVPETPLNPTTPTTKELEERENDSFTLNKLELTYANAGNN